MAADTEAVLHQSQSGYKSFCRVFFFATAFVVVALILMAIFLL